MRHDDRMNALPAARATTKATLLDAYHAERRFDIERLSPEALAGLLILSLGSPLNAALAMRDTVDGHFLRRALPAIREAENKVHIPEPIQATVPNPGSEAAIAGGCSCPVLDNGHGRGSGWGDGAFWITGGCPLHDTGAFNAG